MLNPDRRCWKTFMSSKLVMLLLCLSRQGYMTSECQILRFACFIDQVFFIPQAIAQVRTVYSFVGESKAINSYSETIQNTLKLGYKAGMAKGLGIGCTYGIACMSWALVFWYAGVFIRNGQTDGGKAFTAIFSAIVGGM